MTRLMSERISICECSYMKTGRVKVLREGGGWLCCLCPTKVGQGGRTIWSRELKPLARYDESLSYCTSSSPFRHVCPGWVIVEGTKRPSSSTEVTREPSGVGCGYVYRSISVRECDVVVLQYSCCNKENSPRFVGTLRFRTHSKGEDVSPHQSPGLITDRFLVTRRGTEWRRDDDERVRDCQDTVLNKYTIHTKVPGQGGPRTGGRQRFEVPETCEGRVTTERIVYQILRLLRVFQETSDGRHRQL